MREGGSHHTACLLGKGSRELVSYPGSSQAMREGHDDVASLETYLHGGGGHSRKKKNKKTQDHSMRKAQKPSPMAGTCVREGPGTLVLFSCKGQ